MSSAIVNMVLIPSISRLEDKTAGEPARTSHSRRSPSAIRYPTRGSAKMYMGLLPSSPSLRRRCIRWVRNTRRFQGRPGLHTRRCSSVVGKGRLELPRLSAHDPKSCSSANSDTSPEAPAHRTARYAETQIIRPLSARRPRGTRRPQRRPRARPPWIGARRGPCPRPRPPADPAFTCGRVEAVSDNQLCPWPTLSRTACPEHILGLPRSCLRLLGARGIILPTQAETRPKPCFPRNQEPRGGGLHVLSA